MLTALKFNSRDISLRGFMSRVFPRRRCQSAPPHYVSRKIGHKRSIQSITSKEVQVPLRSEARDLRGGNDLTRQPTQVRHEFQPKEVNSSRTPHIQFNCSTEFPRKLLLAFWQTKNSTSYPLSRAIRKPISTSPLQTSQSSPSSVNMESRLFVCFPTF